MPAVCRALHSCGSSYRSVRFAIRCMTPRMIVAAQDPHVNQFQKPTGQRGRALLARMNRFHSKLTDWGLAHVSIGKNYTILDVGCGGGRTVNKLAAIATEGKVWGVDYSEESVAATERTNARRIKAGGVKVRQSSVSQLPFERNTFDLVTAVETHYFWPDLHKDLQEIFRVLKPAGTFLLIAEVYVSAHTTAAELMKKYPDLAGMTVLTPDEHCDSLVRAGFSDVVVTEETNHGWISVTGKKPS